MKSMIINFGLFLMLFITSISIAAVARKQIIKEEINEAMSLSIRNTMELWVADNSISEEVLAENFLNIFKKSINSKSSFNIYFYNIDTVDGLIDVEVEAEFKYPNKKDGKLIVRKTMIYDEKMN